MQDLISIIIPVYNVEQFLPKCLDSVISQTYRNLEIILIDDGSTDRSGIICDEYKLKDNRIKVIHQGNQGIGCVRNIGLKECRGDFVGFVDSDDYIKPEMFFILHEELLKYKAEIACCASYRVEIDNKLRVCYDNFQDKKVYCDDEVFEKYLECHFGYMLWNKLFKTDIVKNIDFPNTKIGEDLWFLIQTFYLTQKVVCINEPLYYYVKRSSSLTETTKKLDYVKNIELFEITKNIFSFIKVNKSIYVPKVINGYIKSLTEMYQNICLDKRFEDLKIKILRELNDNRNIINEYLTIKGSKKFKIKCLLDYRWLFVILVYYEKYIGGIEKKIRRGLYK